MNKVPISKVLLAGLAAAAFIFLTDYVFHGILMKGTYTVVEGVHREMPDFTWYIIGLLIFATMFAYIYVKGAETGTRVSQGIRYGVTIAIMVALGMGLILHSLQMATPLSQTLIPAAFSLVQFAVAGIIVAYLTGFPGGDRGRDAIGDDD